MIPQRCLGQIRRQGNGRGGHDFEGWRGVADRYRPGAGLLQFGWGLTGEWMGSLGCQAQCDGWHAAIVWYGQQPLQVPRPGGEELMVAAAETTPAAGSRLKRAPESGANGGQLGGAFGVLAGILQGATDKHEQQQDNATGQRG